MNFGDKLRNLRIESGMNQVEFAALLGTTKQNINRYENSEREPNLRTAKAYADKLGVSLVDLCDDSVNVPRRIEKTGPAVAAETVPFPGAAVSDPAVAKYYSLDTVDRSKTEAYMDGLLSAEKYAAKKSTAG